MMQSRASPAARQPGAMPYLAAEVYGPASDRKWGYAADYLPSTRLARSRFLPFLPAHHGRQPCPAQGTGQSEDQANHAGFDDIACISNRHRPKIAGQSLPESAHSEAAGDHEREIKRKHDGSRNHAADDPPSSAAPGEQGPGGERQQQMKSKHAPDRVRTI